ncbi:5'(3')-deoxyribonucleotidase, mitochondrial isoform 2-T2 [Syngnathus typhle]
MIIITFVLFPRINVVSSRFDRTSLFSAFCKASQYRTVSSNYGVGPMKIPLHAETAVVFQADNSEKAISIWESKGFFSELEPLPGGVEAVKQMANMDNTDVFICTSPIKHFKHCPYEKYAWVEKHLGHDFLEQVILTRDKTVVSGDVLIDDKPDILGVEPKPTWEHVLFSACHNKHHPAKPWQRRLLSWSDDWRAILDSKRQ